MCELVGIIEPGQLIVPFNVGADALWRHADGLADSLVRVALRWYCLEKSMIPVDKMHGTTRSFIAVHGTLTADYD